MLGSSASARVNAALIFSGSSFSPWNPVERLCRPDGLRQWEVFSGERAMRSNRLILTISAAVVTALIAGGGIDVRAQQGTRAVPLGTSAGLDGLLSSTLVFFAADADKD